MGGEEAGKTKIWVKCGQVDDSFFVEPELYFAQPSQVNALLGPLLPGQSLESAVPERNRAYSPQ